MNSFDFRSLSELPGCARSFVSTHRRGLAVTLLVLTGGFAAAAFGIAPMMPDAALLPRHMIVEDVQPEPLDPQLEALAGHLIALDRNETTRPGDTADSLLRRLGVSDAAAAAFLRNDAKARRLFDGRSGKMVSATMSSDGRLQRLVARYPAEGADVSGDRGNPAAARSPAAADNGLGKFNRLTLSQTTPGVWQAEVQVLPLVAGVRLASGTIRSSLFAASDDADIPDPIAVQMAEMFSTDIDFHRELRKGDTFSVVYESLTADGEPINWNQGAGRVLAAEFINDGHAYQAMWFGEGRGGYYDFQGVSKRRSFLASPLAFSRITSGFAMRFHPILQSWRAHKGVDYGAPTGTPVHCVGDGTVSFAGWQNGYGNVVQVSHSGDRMTVYAHMSKIEVRKGDRVAQGQEVGRVGATGWATGPHLHFEFRVHGEHQDPLSVAKSSETMVLDVRQKARFAVLAMQTKAQLSAAEALQGRAGMTE